MAYVIKHNNPSVGYISWQNLNMQYNGTSYPITNGNTNLIYSWWAISNPTKLQSSNTFPTLTAADALVLLNKNGTAILVPGSTVLDGSLVVPGSILADALSANSVTGEKILAGEIDTSHIKAGAITSKTIAADAVGAEAIAAETIVADHIHSDAITSDKIVAKAITTDKIAAKAVTATKIDANAITAGKIKAGEIDTVHLKAGAITASKISVSSLSAIKADLGTVTAGTLDLSNAGMTSQGALSTSIRTWAGSTYANRDSAPFRVTQDGSVYMNKANIETESINNQYVKMYGSRIDGGRQDYGLSYVIGTAEYTGASRSGVVQLFGYSSGTSTSISRQLDVGNNLIQVKGSNLVLGGSVESRPTVITRTTYLSDLTRSVPSDVALYVKGGLQVKGPITGITAGDLPEHPHYTTGVNSNGTYVKYDDGTMICYASAKPITIGNMEELPSGIWRTDNSSHIEVTFPGTFISRPTVQINIYVGEALNVPPRFIYTTHFNGRFLSTVDHSNRNTKYDLFAIGRWK